MYSVVIPTYNSSKTIQRTIESVLCQTIPSKIIYIIDDLSDDLALLKKILEQYGERVSIIESAEKTNAANNRNKGWELVQEEFVFFLDSDDEWMPFHAEEVIKLFNKNKYVDCVCTAFLARQINGRSYLCNSAYIDMEKIDNPLDLLFTGLFDFRSSCIALKTKAFKKVKFDASLKKHQDWDLFLSLEANGFSVDRVTKSTVQINEIGSGRMSAKNNLEASFYFIDKWVTYQTKFNFNQLFKMFYISAFKNNTPQEIKVLNNYLSQIEKNILSPPIRLLSITSKISYVLAKSILLKLIWMKGLRNKF